MQKSIFSVHPFIIFWLGLLTGALIVGFVFLYQALNSADYSNALLKYSRSTKTDLSGRKTMSTQSIPNTDGW